MTPLDCFLCKDPYQFSGLPCKDSCRRAENPAEIGSPHLRLQRRHQGNEALGVHTGEHQIAVVDMVDRVDVSRTQVVIGVQHCHGLRFSPRLPECFGRAAQNQPDFGPYFSSGSAFAISLMAAIVTPAWAAWAGQRPTAT